MADEREAVLLDAFVSISGMLASDYEIADVLEVCVDVCLRLLRADSAGILMQDEKKELFVVASSDNETQLLEMFQLDLDSGPCLETFRTGEVLQVAELAEAQARWPTWAEAAKNTGVQAITAVPMRHRDTVIGSVNLFRFAPGALSEADVRVVESLAAVATVGILSNRALEDGKQLASQLQRALDTRVVIEQAKGVLAERNQITPSQAWELMRSHARRNQLRVSSLAQAVIDQSPDLPWLPMAAEQ